MVDSHFDPLRRTGDAAAHDPSPLDNIQSRPQAANAAFGVQSTLGFTECLEDPDGSYTLYCTVFGPQAPVSTFSDDVTWYPGIEIRPEIGPFALFFRDSDASVVVPSDLNQLYSVRFVNPDGSLATSHVLYGLDLGGNLVLGTGNPSDGYDVFNPTDLSMGVIFQISKVYAGNTHARIYVDPGN
jgi:immune inhibitor A